MPGISFHNVPNTFIYDDADYFEEYENDKNHDFVSGNYDFKSFNDYVGGY